tara:strand:+ start:308 stop:526 length:219 start_codon:yes stop_codon:yes gene_type:complete
MKKVINYYHNNVSDKDKLRMQQIAGINIEAGIKMDVSLVNIGLDARKEEAKRKCAERRARREAKKNEKIVDK